MQTQIDNAVIIYICLVAAAVLAFVLENSIDLFKWLRK